MEDNNSKPKQEMDFSEVGKILKEFIPEKDPLFAKIFDKMVEKFDLKTQNDFNLADHYLLSQLQLRITMEKIKHLMKPSK